MAINEITDKIRKSINTIYTVYYISFLSDCMTIFSVLKPYTSKCFKEKGDNVMAKVKEEQSSQQTKQVLAFSTRLRHDLKKACRQLDEGEGQEDVTISKEVEAWLNK